MLEQFKNSIVLPVPTSEILEQFKKSSSKFSFKKVYTTFQY